MIITDNDYYWLWLWLLLIMIITGNGYWFPKWENETCLPCMKEFVDDRVNLSDR